LLTLAICTRNRAARLRRLLEGLTRQHTVDAPWEVLVVDNGSTDGTAAVAAGFAGRLPLRHLCEPCIGLSNARNRAVEEAAGEVIVWVDDDVEVPESWLGAWVDGIRAHPGASFFGAGVRVVFDVEPPTWIRACWSRLAPLFAERVVPVEGGLVDPGYLPFGANFAVRTAVQRGARYDPSLGRRGTSVYGGEETTLLSALVQAGHEGRWIAGAELDHVMEPARVETARLFDQIRQNARLLGASESGEEAGRAGAGTLRWRWITNTILWRVSRRTRPPAVWVPRFIAAAVWRGHLDRRTASGGGDQP
jgi:glycosyltransferase involved in cell wall biosynthesis